MSGLPSLRYPLVPSPSPDTRWGHGWRKLWFRHVGSVHQHHETGELVAFYSEAHDPAWRLHLQAVLEAQPGGVGKVLAACAEHMAAFNDMIDDAYRRREPREVAA